MYIKKNIRISNFDCLYQNCLLLLCVFIFSSSILRTFFITVSVRYVQGKLSESVAPGFNDALANTHLIKDFLLKYLFGISVD